jgi:hypothetical protein
MCGRALEEICRNFGVKRTTLGPGLRSLRNQGVIDGRLFEWATSLQKSRNFSAHASDRHVSQRDAADLLDFTYAICEYVFVLASKFTEFQKRDRARKP